MDRERGETDMSIETLSVGELKENLKDFTLIDVRREDEFYGELGHIQGSVLVTRGPDLTKYLESLEDKNQKIVFICRSGHRSELAALESQNLGFKHVYNLKGGMTAWSEQES